MSAATNPLAFPHVTQSKRAGSETIYTHVTEGMTLRDWFAGQTLGALVTLAADGSLGEREGLTNGQTIAANAYEMANAMLAERAKERGQ